LIAIKHKTCCKKQYQFCSYKKTSSDSTQEQIFLMMFSNMVNYLFGMMI